MIEVGDYVRFRNTNWYPVGLFQIVEIIDTQDFSIGLMYILDKCYTTKLDTSNKTYDFCVEKVVDVKIIRLEKTKKILNDSSW